MDAASLLTSWHASQPCDTIIQAGCVVTQDDQRRVLQDHAIIIHAGHVQRILPIRDASHIRCATQLDLRHCMVLPGLVNAHTHAAMTLFRGMGDDMPLLRWLEDRIWPLEAGLTKELTALGSQLACCEMASFGTTCFQDMYVFQEATASVVDSFGMRAVLAEGVINFPTRNCLTPEATYAYMANLLADFAGHPRIRFAMAPHTAHTTSEAILRRSFKLAQAYDTPWCIHCAEDAEEIVRVEAMFGKRPVALLDSLGCLTPRSLLVHGVELLPEEIDLLQQRGASLAHCPRSNAKLASGMAPVSQCLDHEVNVALGTDGAASSNSLNMFAEMGMAALLAKGETASPTALPAQAVLDMATRNAAQALGWPELGQLKEGGPADLAAVSLNAPRLTPCFNPVSHAVYACQGADVVLTMAHGQPIFELGRFPTIDYPALLEAVDDALAWTKKRLDSIST